MQHLLPAEDKCALCFDGKLCSQPEGLVFPSGEGSSDLHEMTKTITVHMSRTRKCNISYFIMTFSQTAHITLSVYNLRGKCLI